MSRLLAFKRRRAKRPTFKALGALSIAIAGAIGFAGGGMLHTGGSSALATDLYVPTLRKCYDKERNTSTKTCVVDGDTLWLHGTDYRLKDFDTPEPLSNICGGAAEVALANKASARLLELLNSNKWTIETYGFDNTGKRVLATILIDGQDVGDILISERLARRWPNGDEWWCRL